MKPKTYRTILVVTVAALVILAGCTGDGGSPDVPGADDGNADGGSDDGGAGNGDGGFADGGDESGAAGDGTSGDDADGASSDSDAGDGSDGAAGDGDDAGDVDDSASDGDDPVSSTPTPASEGGDGTPDVDDGGTSASFADGGHTRALAESGSYTLEYTIEGQFSGMGGSETVLVGREQVDYDTGERYSTLESRGEGENFTFEYYLPPNSDTAYQRGMGQVMEVDASYAVFFNYSDPGTGESAEEWPEFSEAGSGETALGPATKWVVDSVEDLPEATREEYDTIESVEFTMWVDEETGVIAKYDYRISYVDDGESGNFRMTIELSDLGSTTVTKPDWAP